MSTALLPSFVLTQLQQLPFVLILFDAQRHRAFWVQIREHVDGLGPEIDPEQCTIDLKIPWTNKLTANTIDKFRDMSLKRLERDK